MLTGSGGLFSSSRTNSSPKIFFRFFCITSFNSRFTSGAMTSLLIVWIASLSASGDNSSISSLSSSDALDRFEPPSGDVTALHGAEAWVSSWRGLGGSSVEVEGRHADVEGRESRGRTMRDASVMTSQGAFVKESTELGGDQWTGDGLWTGTGGGRGEEVRWVWRGSGEACDAVAWDFFLLWVSVAERKTLSHDDTSDCSQWKLDDRRGDVTSSRNDSDDVMDARFVSVSAPTVSTGSGIRALKGSLNDAVASEKEGADAKSAWIGNCDVTVVFTAAAAPMTGGDWHVTGSRLSLVGNILVLDGIRVLDTTCGKTREMVWLPEIRMLRLLTSAKRETSWVLLCKPRWWNTQLTCYRQFIIQHQGQFPYIGWKLNISTYLYRS